MQHSTRSLHPIPPELADVGQGSLGNDNSSVQSNEPRFSPILPPEHLPDSRQPRCYLCYVLPPSRIVNCRSMQHSTGSLHPILPELANVGQGSLGNDNSSVQSNEPRFSLILRQPRYYVGYVLRPSRIVNSRSMQPSTGSLHSIPPELANVGQGSLITPSLLCTGGPPVQSNGGGLIVSPPEHFPDSRQLEYSLCDIPSAPTVTRKSKQPSTRRLRKLLPKPANVGQGSLSNGNPPVQSNDGVLVFSLTLTPEDFPDLREPEASTNDIPTTESSMNSRRNDFERVCDTRPENGSLRCRFCRLMWPSKRSLLVHLRKHIEDASRENDLLLEKLASRLSALGYWIDVTPVTTPYEQEQIERNLGKNSRSPMARSAV
ncbi:hypothetical protein MTO96_004991 [Rhipicephalus appendiculatus]